jgi:hypothetical protein
MPAYTNNRHLSRVLLLAAYHDAIPDPSCPGLIVKGKTAVSPCLTYEGFTSESNLTLEHIAPQDKTAGWNADLYLDKEVIHRLGNLVLVPMVANSSFSSRPWSHKRILYQVLGASSQGAAEKILEDARSSNGVEFGVATHVLLQSSKYLPQLAAIGERAEDWTPDFVDQRSRRLLTLAYSELYRWLE